MNRRPSIGLWLAIALIVLIVIIVAIVLFGQDALRRSAPSTPTIPPTAAGKPGAATPLDGLVAVHFTDPKDPDRPEDRRGGLDEKLTAFLKEATTSIDVAIYDLDLTNVTAALVDASKRGVTVRLVTDTDNLKNDAIVTLQAAKIPVIEDKRSAIMHHKFAVVDRAAVWMGSWNFTVYDTYRYNNNGALWRNKPLAEKYAAEFEKLFAGQFGARGRTDKPAADVVTDEQRGIRMEVYFTPEDDPEPAIVNRVRAAQRSVIFLAYSFTSDPIGGAMRDAGKRGVQVRGVFEKTGTEAANSPSEFRSMKEAGLDVLQDGNRYLMHHKVIVIDERTVIFGSYNFSANARDNNENLLIVDSPDLARLFTQEFERVYAKAAAAK